jgi:DNA-binding MarR family transcriptional regulator
MDAFEENLFYQLASVCAEAKQAFVQRLGMSQARYHLLALLAEKGEIRHAALQQYLLLDGATITRLVKQFESEGLVSRRLDPQDNRYTFASLTDAGWQVMAGIGEAHRVFVTRLLDGIANEDQEVTLRVLKHLRATIRLVQEEDLEQG